MLLLLLSACGGEPPRAAEAVAVTWASYGSTHNAPDVKWVDPNCHDGHGFLEGLVVKCVGGLHYPGIVYVALGAQRYSDTALAHELMHEYLLVELGNPDAEHSGSDWSRVELANAELRAVGL